MQKLSHGVRECPNNNFGIEYLEVNYLSKKELLNIYQNKKNNNLTDYLTIPKKGYYTIIGLEMGNSAIVRNDNNSVQIIYLSDYHNEKLYELNKKAEDLNLVKVFINGFKKTIY